MSHVLERYRALVAAHELRADAEQLAAAERLDALAQQLEAVPKKGSILWRALGRAPSPRAASICGAASAAANRC